MMIEMEGEGRKRKGGGKRRMRSRVFGGTKEQRKEKREKRK